VIDDIDDIGFEGRGDRLRVRDRALYALLLIPTDGLTPFDVAAFEVVIVVDVEVIDHQYRVSGLEEAFREMRTDETSAAREEELQIEKIRYRALGASVSCSRRSASSRSSG